MDPCGCSTVGLNFTRDFEIRSWVLTNRELDLPDGLQRFEGDVRDLHPLLREAAGDRDVWIMGGGDVAGQFADAGLLDKVWIHVTPVILGAGAPLLPRRRRLRREAVGRDGRFTAMLFSVVGEDPKTLRDDPVTLDVPRRPGVAKLLKLSHDSGGL